MAIRPAVPSSRFEGGLRFVKSDAFGLSQGANISAPREAKVIKVLLMKIRFILLFGS